MQVPHLAGGYKPTLRALIALCGALSAGISGIEAPGRVLINESWVSGGAPMSDSGHKQT